MRHLSLVVLAVLLISPAAARAQAPSPAPSPTTTTTSPPNPASEQLFRVYGILNTRVTGASGAVESFSNPNGVAITAAANPAVAFSADDPRYTFQAAQTRFGIWVNEKGPVRGQIELDFVDFTKATPTVASLPRVRIARADLTVTENNVISLGQDWDMHAPINPHGINMVGGVFQAGNSAFMRQQLKYFHTGVAFEAGAALGFPFNNNTGRDGVAETFTLPTLAVRGAYKLGKSKVGASAIATRLLFAQGTPNERGAMAGAVAVFADLNPLPTTNLRVELNLGQNDANLGLLTIAQGNPTEDLQDAGGFISARHAFTPRHAVIAMAGYERIIGGTPVASYSYPTATPSTATLSAGAGPGMRHNGTLRVGYEFKPTSLISLVVEGYGYQTSHVLLAEDLAAGWDPVRRAVGLDVGALLAF